MSHNMSIYRRLNPRTLVQAGLAWAYYIGLICLIYISNKSKQHRMDLQEWDLPLCALGLRSERMKETKVEKWEKKTLRNGFIH